MLYFPEYNLVFLHCPKTGGTFIRELVKRLDITSISRQPIHGDLELARQRYGKQVQAFTILRHPAEWLRSYWADRMKGSWAGELPIAHECADLNFNGFASKVVTKFPGFVTELFTRYAGKPGDSQPVWVYPYPQVFQSLLESLIRAGASAQFDLSKLPGMDLHNTAPSWLLNQACYNSDTYARLCVVEREIIARYGML